MKRATSWQGLDTSKGTKNTLEFLLHPGGEWWFGGVFRHQFGPPRRLRKFFPCCPAFPQAYQNTVSLACTFFFSLLPGESGGCFFVRKKWVKTLTIERERNDVLLVYGCHNTVILYANLNYRVMRGKFSDVQMRILNRRGGGRRWSEQNSIYRITPFFCSAPSNRANLGDRN